MEDITKKIMELEAEIEGIKRALPGVGAMRPGNLTQQYRNPKEKKGPYWQLSYTHQMKSHTQYVRSGSVEAVREETGNYRKFKELTDRWVALSIEVSKLRMRLDKSDQPES